MEFIMKLVLFSEGGEKASFANSKQWPGSPKLRMYATLQFLQFLVMNLACCSYLDTTIQRKRT